MTRNCNSSKSQRIDECIVEFDIQNPELPLVCVNSRCKRCLINEKKSHQFQFEEYDQEFHYMQDIQLKKNQNILQNEFNEIDLLQEEIVTQQDTLKHLMNSNDDKETIKKIQDSIKYLMEELQYLTLLKIQFEKDYEIIK